jgi:hypothetical protein
MAERAKATPSLYHNCSCAPVAQLAQGLLRDHVWAASLLEGHDIIQAAHLMIPQHFPLLPDHCITFTRFLETTAKNKQTLLGSAAMAPRAIAMLAFRLAQLISTPVAQLAQGLLREHVRAASILESHA